MTRSLALWRLWGMLTLGVAGLGAPAQGAPPPIDAYGRLPAVEDVSLSPTGQRYAVITVVGGDRRLVAMTVDGSKVLFAGDLGKTKARAVEWADEDHLLVSLTATAKLGIEFTRTINELEAVVVINVKTQKRFGVFKGRYGVAEAVWGEYGLATFGGHSYGYFGGTSYVEGYMEHVFPDLYRVDLDTGDLLVAAKGGENTDGWLVSPTGAVLARSKYTDASGDWSVITGVFGGKTLASGQNPFEGAGTLELGRTPDLVLIEHPSSSGPIYEQTPLAGGRAEIVPESADIAETLFDRSTRLWIGRSVRGDIPDYVMFDSVVAAKVRGMCKAFPGLSVSLRSWSDDFNRMVVFTSGGDDSGTYWLVDIATGRAQPIGEDYPAVKAADVGPISMVEWKAADGLDLHGVLSLPPGRPANALPLVVLPHGDPEARDYPVFDWWAQAFAARGYAVFQPNFRGSSGYGQAFRDAGFGQWGSKMQTDISDGVAALARQGVIDPKRVCIMGGSYGGYASLAGVTLQQGLYRCAVSVAGVSDPEALLTYERERSGGTTAATRYVRAFMGVKSVLEGELNAISPVKQAAKADAPILLIHGKDDTVVPIEESYAMERALKSAGKRVELVVMPGEDHWLSSEATRLLMLRSAVDFIERNNPTDRPAR